jgi:hypothetical protein
MGAETDVPLMHPPRDPLRKELLGQLPEPLHHRGPTRKYERVSFEECSYMNAVVRNSNYMASNDFLMVRNELEKLWK